MPLFNERLENNQVATHLSVKVLQIGRKMIGLGLMSKALTIPTTKHGGSVKLFKPKATYQDIFL